MLFDNPEIHNKYKTQRYMGIASINLLAPLRDSCLHGWEVSHESGGSLGHSIIAVCEVLRGEEQTHKLARSQGFDE